MTEILTILNFLQEYWLILAALFSYLFFARRKRVEEILKIKLNTILDCYKCFAELNDLVQTWAHASTHLSSDEKTKIFYEQLNQILPEAREYFYRCSLLLRPQTVVTINSMFIYLNLIHAEYMNWKMYLDSGNEYNTELKTSYDKCRKIYPDRIESATSTLLTDLQILVHGKTVLFWWNVTPRLYEEIRKVVSVNLYEKIQANRSAILKEINTVEIIEKN